MRACRSTRPHTACLHEPVGVHALTLEDIMRDTPTKSSMCGLIAQRLHGRITPHLDAGRRWNTDKLYAAATALLIRCPFRSGWRAVGPKQAGGAASDGDAPHVGLTSLQNKHIRVLPNSEQAHFDFCGKSGKTNTCDIFSDGEANTKLIRLLHTLSQSGKADEPLFRYHT